MTTMEGRVLSLSFSILSLINQLFFLFFNFIICLYFVDLVLQLLDPITVLSRRIRGCPPVTTSSLVITLKSHTCTLFIILAS